MHVLGNAFAWLVVGVVFRCPNPSDESVPLFTDRPCAGGVALSEVAPNAVAPAALTSEERAMLDRIERTRSTPAKKARDVDADDRRDERCNAARKGLDELRATRRHGYRASASARLDAKESRLRAEVDASCGAP